MHLDHRSAPFKRNGNVVSAPISPISPAGRRGEATEWRNGRIIDSKSHYFLCVVRSVWEPSVSGTHKTRDLSRSGSNFFNQSPTIAKTHRCGKHAAIVRVLANHQSFSTDPLSLPHSEGAGNLCQTGVAIEFPTSARTFLRWTVDVASRLVAVTNSVTGCPVRTGVVSPVSLRIESNWE